MVFPFRILIYDSPLLALYSLFAGFTKCYKTNFKAWIGPFLMLFIRDADDLKTILNSEKCFDKVSILYEKVIDYGLLVIGGETYKLHRKSINPIFHPTQLKSFIPIIKRKMDDFLLRFDSRIETSEEIEMSHFASDFTLDTILATMFSNNDITENERMRFIVSSEKYKKLKLILFVINHFFLHRYLLISCAKIFKWWLLIKPLFRLSKIYWPYMNSKDEINRFAEALMINFEKKYQQKLKAVDHKPQLFLDNFYNVRNTMTYKETRESVLTFLVAGFDTTGKTIPGVLLLLAMHQEIQENVLRELRKMKDEDMTEKTLNTLTYLDMVIKESLRLFPVGLLVARTVKEDIELSTHNCLNHKETKFNLIFFREFYCAEWNFYRLLSTRSSHR